MNIFVLEVDPGLAARAVDDRRVGAALKEVAQMLATASIVLGGTPPLRVDGQPYRPTHTVHPCSRWVGSSRAAWEWTVAYAEALSAEHRARFGTAHRSFDAVIACDRGPKPTAVDAPLFFVIGMENAAEPAGTLLTADRAVAVYRDYYRQAKGPTASYQRGREAPDWMMRTVRA